MKRYREPDSSSKNEEVLDDIPLTDGVLHVNLGVPIIVFCCKSDLVWTVDKHRDQNERILDCALRTLREFCLTGEAALGSDSLERPSLSFSRRSARA